MARTTVEGIEGVQALVGRHLGYSDWVTVTQERVNQFADATGDHQWIHVDPERATRESPFGGPIAHGYLTLSLIPMLVPQIVEVTGFRMGVNYGTEKVRFPAPVPVGGRVRAGATLDSVTPFDGGIAMVMTVTVEVEGASKPSMVAHRHPPLPLTTGVRGRAALLQGPAASLRAVGGRRVLLLHSTEARAGPG